GFEAAHLSEKIGDLHRMFPCRVKTAVDSASTPTTLRRNRRHLQGCPRRRASGWGFHLYVDARHEGQQAAVEVLEERHPFLGAVGVAMNHMRGAAERDAAGLQLRVGVVDILDRKVDQ